MKTKVQKGEELKKAKTLLDKSQALVFADFSKVTAEDVRKLRIELKKSGANFLVIKKRLLGLLLKERGINADLNQFKLSVGTIFAEGSIEEAAGPAYKFFSGMPIVEGGAKDMWIKHLLSGYDMKSGALIDSAQIVYIGKLPPREVLLAQLLGMLTAPIRSFMYVLDQKAKQGGGSVSAKNEAVANDAMNEPAISEPATPASEPVASEAAAPVSASPSNDNSNPEQKVEHASTVN